MDVEVISIMLDCGKWTTLGKCGEVKVKATASTAESCAMDFNHHSMMSASTYSRKGDGGRLLISVHHGVYIVCSAEMILRWLRRLPPSLGEIKLTRNQDLDMHSKS